MLRIATTLVVAFVIAGCGTDSADQSTTKEAQTTTAASTRAAASPPSAAAQPTMPQPAPPKYSVVGSSTNVRLDNKVTYDVAISPVDLTSDSFKQGVRSVLEDIASTHGGDPNFSADVYDDDGLAKTEYANLGTPLADPEGVRALDVDEQQHLVAMYDGGIDQNSAQPGTGESAYSISWYPSADEGTPNVGKYVALDERWKP
jgi:hypothetical protein